MSAMRTVGSCIQSYRKFTFAQYVHDEILLSSGREIPVKLDSRVPKPSVILFCPALWRVTIPWGVCNVQTIIGTLLSSKQSK